MHPVPNTNGSISNSATPGETGDIAEAFTGKDHYQNLISHANSVPMSKIFRHYNIHLDLHIRKTTCPFKSHKGGRESTPSFNFYPDTNSFYCFGCKAGTRACDFVSEMDHCNKSTAARKILELFESDVEEDNIYDRANFTERLEIMLNFSDTIREFHQNFPTEHARLYADAACQKYDALNLRKNLSNEALRRIVEQLKDYILLYSPQ